MESSILVAERQLYNLKAVVVDSSMIASRSIYSRSWKVNLKQDGTEDRVSNVE